MKRVMYMHNLLGSIKYTFRHLEENLYHFFHNRGFSSSHIDFEETYLPHLSSKLLDTSYDLCSPCHANPLSHSNHCQLNN